MTHLRFNSLVVCEQKKLLKAVLNLNSSTTEIVQIAWILGLVVPPPPTIPMNCF